MSASGSHPTLGKPASKILPHTFTLLKSDLYQAYTDKQHKLKVSVTQAAARALAAAVASAEVAAQVTEEEDALALSIATAKLAAQAEEIAAAARLSEVELIHGQMKSYLAAQLMSDEKLCKGISWKFENSQAFKALRDYPHDLLINSFRAGATKVEITLNADAEKNLVTITLKDDGTGFEEDAYDKQLTGAELAAVKAKLAAKEMLNWEAVCTTKLKSKHVADHKATGGRGMALTSIYKIVTSQKTGGRGDLHIGNRSDGHKGAVVQIRSELGLDKHPDSTPIPTPRAIPAKHAAPAGLAGGAAPSPRVGVGSLQFSHSLRKQVQSRHLGIVTAATPTAADSKSAVLAISHVHAAELDSPTGIVTVAVQSAAPSPTAAAASRNGTPKGTPLKPVKPKADSIGTPHVAGVPPHHPRNSATPSTRTRQLTRLGGGSLMEPLARTLTPEITTVPVYSAAGVAATGSPSLSVPNLTLARSSSTGALVRLLEGDKQSHDQKSQVVTQPRTLSYEDADAVTIVTAAAASPVHALSVFQASTGGSKTPKPSSDAVAKPDSGKHARKSSH